MQNNRFDLELGSQLCKVRSVLGLHVYGHVTITQIRGEQLVESKVKGETVDQDSAGCRANSITTIRRKKTCGFGESWSQDFTEIICAF